MKTRRGITYYLEIKEKATAKTESDTLRKLKELEIDDIILKISVILNEISQSQKTVYKLMLLL